MNYFNYISILLISLLISCQSKNDLSQVTNEFNEEEYNSLFDPNRYMLPTPEGVYIPEGLSKLSFLEQIIYNQKMQGNLDSIVFRNSKGVVTPFDTLFSPFSTQKLIVQLYKDHTGKVTDGVAFEVTDEFKKMVKEEYTPSDGYISKYPNQKAKKNRFLIPTLPNVYVPSGLRKLNLMEILHFLDLGTFDIEKYDKKNDKGELVDEDFLKNNTKNKFIQVFVDDKDKVKEIVAYDMSDEVSALLTLMRFVR